MTGYSKLFSSIIHSTVWREPSHIRLVWITLLAMKDHRGEVHASVPGLADAARVTLDECIEALEKLRSPDQWSRSVENEGRRIEDIPGGWFVLNHQKYRDLMSAEERRIRDAARKREARARERSDACGHVRTVSQTDTDPEAEATQEPSGSAGEPSEIQKVRSVFNRWREALGHPRSKLDGSRKAKIRARLRDFSAEQLCVAIDGVALSDWHMGRDPKTGGKRYDDFKTIFRDAEQVEKFIDIAEGKQSGAVQSGKAPAFEAPANLRALSEERGIPLDPIVKRLSAALSWSERSFQDQVRLVGQEVMKEAKRRTG